ncbi:hypothetical protein [uncultured Maribacter sp.]|uniref:hypothetical protein n=1 Tax=uncultured Maribacter sp. TaxID=431308 RepID=UPI00342E8998
MYVIARASPDPDSDRIFAYTLTTTMEKQYCKVGSTTPLGNGNQSISLLEYQYQNFMEKASNIKYSDSKLGEFFELKAKKIKKDLENLMH